MRHTAFKLIFNILSLFINVHHAMMRMPFVVMVHHDVVETFFPDRDETYTAVETEAIQDLKNLETDKFKFRFRAATFF
jgi:hypothetical protein